MISSASYLLPTLMSVFDQKKFHFSLFWFLHQLPFPGHEAHENLKRWSLCKVFHNYIETMLENKSWNKDTQTHLYTDSHNDSHSYPTGFILPNLTNFDLCCLMKVWDLSGQITNDSYMFSIWDWFTKRLLHLDLNFLSLLL